MTEAICRELASGVLAEHAAEVDRDARFPKEALAALRSHGLLSAAAPAGQGGLGADVPALARMAARLARGCGSTAMIWAMHQVQLACLLASDAGPELGAAVNRIVRDQLLVASATSEAGVGGALRRSACAVERDDPSPAARPDAGEPASTARLDKHATTVSYGLEADALLVSARRGPDSPPGDQVAVLLDAADASLETLGGWNPLGMRGTCSPALRIRAAFADWRILPVPFGDLVARVMTPLSHVLWSGVWYGLAAEAADRAAAHARGRAGTGSPPSGALAEMRWRLSAVEAQLAEAARAAQAVLTGAAEPTVAFTLLVNSLKLAASQVAVDVALAALRVCGMAGYSEDGPHSVARLVRDLLSAPLMIGNERLVAINAELALVARDR
ncbi:acyl-CoA dehydrogenase family protein [Nonomuraea roseoviolacea subsp. roseoviolacea]|uniref:Acyl-CoA dehydrogenase n=1 Tax=Nonomuraea roseoviolacea subsp. carminata TaxID=160689 RepID=A0ABT1KB68_9ACTN|nr:acyl-CoA dehydrogenase family protein [Nonomuraea roseoviolacea]MCP2351254.1 acyl-CoA dehydrogenase [Nonomuraea roseoviolacea subsp. carminata]